MFTDLNKELHAVKEKLRKKKKYEEHLQRTTESLKGEKKKRDELERQLAKEKEDVARLESFTLTTIFYTITGRKLEKLDKEQQEVLAAKLKYKEALETIEDLEREIHDYEKELAQVADADYVYKQLLTKKEQLIQDTNSNWSDQLLDLVEQEAEVSSNLKEYNEAIEAGEQTMAKLEQAIQSLDSAKGWSTFDMFGGGIISTAVKHSHLDDAKDHIHQVQKQLRRFQDELLDIENHFNTNLEIGGLLTFADYFFDGIIFDWFVHGQISDCYDRTLKTKKDVSNLFAKLVKQRDDLNLEFATIKERRKAILESAD